MRLKNYSRVKLLTDRYKNEGVGKGDIGYIIEVYNDGAYEVEFSEPSGITIAQIVVRESEVELAELPKQSR